MQQFCSQTGSKWRIEQTDKYQSQTIGYADQDERVVLKPFKEVAMQDGMNCPLASACGAFKSG